jgi:hypothetical protein
MVPKGLVQQRGAQKASCSLARDCEPQFPFCYMITGRPGCIQTCQDMGPSAWSPKPLR